MPEPSMRACGIVFCYNEEQILRDNLSYYLSEGIDLVVFDNCSTDSSPEIIKEFQPTQENFSGKIISSLRIETQGYEWKKILQIACDYMHQHLSGYDWILLIDSDSFYSSPVKGMPILEFLSYAAKYGYNVLNGKLYDFYPTEKDDLAIVSPTKRMHYCKNKHEELLYVNEKYHRIFQYDPSIDFYSSFGHIVTRSNRRVLNKVRYIYRHYPWVSFEHGKKKIFKDRKPRYVERKFGSLLHKQWLWMLPIEKDFVMQSRGLNYYDEKRILIPRWQFFWIMELKNFSDLFGSLSIWAHFFSPLRLIKALPRYIKNGYAALMHALNVLPASGPWRTLKRLIAEMGRGPAKRANASTTGVRSESFLQALRIKILSYGSVLFQHPIALNYPSVYHFLMTNACNANCLFCNQQDLSGPKDEITLDKFKIFASHIPAGSPSIFIFSGGGEPLLAKDLFAIIKYANETFPEVNIYIRTNGLLIKKYAKELSELKISRLEISLHGPQELNNRIIRNNLSGEIIEGLRVLNQHLAASGKNIHKVFCPALSRVNIEQLPELIKQAKELNIAEVDAFFVRFYPGFSEHANYALKEEDSLFFHKELYNKIIRQSKKLARRAKITLEYEPQFYKKFKEKPCFQPWRVVLVDGSGCVYPCTGGESWFREEVKNKKYNFGNLLKEHVYEFWTNQSFIMIRRTCNLRNRENFVSECFNCHNSICFKGADEKVGHFLTKTSCI
ncbi:MAG: radical SAM protein [Candidatus Omnitrophica bacterium]|nr:radical SAM protein [Candidatus Omnitrophota bacterium]